MTETINAMSREDLLEFVISSSEPDEMLIATERLLGDFLLSNVELSKIICAENIPDVYKSEAFGLLLDKRSSGTYSTLRSLAKKAEGKWAEKAKKVLVERDKE